MSAGNLHVGGDSLAAFTGRASFTALLKANIARQNEIHTEMLTLVNQANVNGSALRLQKHLPPTGNWKLRWRIRRENTTAHCLWEDIGAELDDFPMPIRKHYETVNRRVQELNQLDMMVQYTIKCCGAFLGQPSRAELLRSKAAFE